MYTTVNYNVNEIGNINKAFAFFFKSKIEKIRINKAFDLVPTVKRTVLEST